MDAIPSHEWLGYYQPIYFLAPGRVDFFCAARDKM